MLLRAFKKIPANVIISRTDSVGDCILSLPIATVLKQRFPGIKIAFLGAEYTRSVIETCINVDEFISVDEFMTKDVNVCGKKPEAILHVLPRKNIARRAKELKIHYRVGTRNRVYHWGSCNMIIKLSRKKSLLHEAQLNLKLLYPFGIREDFSLAYIGQLYGMEKLSPLPFSFSEMIDKIKYNLILHPSSRGSAREWGTENFIQLIRLLDKEKFRIFVSGVESERSSIQPILDVAGKDVTDIIGLMPLNEFIPFINLCDGLIACSTGPIHIAAALGKDALGIYAPLWSIRPARWAPVGPKAQVFVVDRQCSDCKKNKHSCHCIKEIAPLVLQKALENVLANTVKA